MTPTLTDDDKGYPKDQVQTLSKLITAGDSKNAANKSFRHSSSFSGNEYAVVPIAPAKVAITEENNMIKIKMLSYDTSGNLTDTVSNTLKSNVANYLSNYRMINDYISIESANPIDLAVNVDVVLDASQNQGAVVSKIIDII